MDLRSLKDLAGIGPAMLRDFDQLGIHSVEQLATADPDALYERLCVLTHSRQDPCVLDVFRCAAAQARDPKLPSEQRMWWYWSRRRQPLPNGRGSVTHAESAQPQLNRDPR